jgi:hypothetical protein
VFRAPILREIAAEGRRENRLPQLLEQRRHGVERLTRATAPRLKGFEVGDDATLLVERWERDSILLQNCLTDVRLCSTLSDASQSLSLTKKELEYERNEMKRDSVRKERRAGLVGGRLKCKHTQFPDGCAVHRDEQRSCRKTLRGTALQSQLRDGLGHFVDRPIG